MKIKLMTSNIWGDYFGNPVNVREDLLFDVYKKYAPDIIGFQEVTNGWYGGKMFSEYLLEDYAFVGTELGGFKNYVPFVYKKSLGLCCLEKGYLLMPETPDESKGITYAVFENKEGEIFAVCNTHFWWKTGDEHDIIREKNARRLSELMLSLHSRYNCPVFAMGDMNCTCHATVFDIYKSHGIVGLSGISEKVEGHASCHGDPVADPDGFYHGQKDTRDISESIDHIIVLGNVTVWEYLVIEDRKALDATDHSPIMASVGF